MLLSIFSSDLSVGMKILMLMISVLALLPALSLHEFAHGYAAYKCGDYTAKSMGRLSLNPLAHLDPFGTLMMLVVGFGWAKPVPINTRNFKKPRRDIAIVSLAGPAMNIILAFIGTLLASLTSSVAVSTGTASTVTASIIYTLFWYFAMMNLGLGLFNLIPLPPLDGSNVLMCLLPQKYAVKYSKIRYYTRYIFLGLIVLQWLPYPLSAVTDILFWPLTAARSGLMSVFTTVADWIMSLFF